MIPSPNSLATVNLYPQTQKNAGARDRTTRRTAAQRGPPANRRTLAPCLNRLHSTRGPANFTCPPIQTPLDISLESSCSRMPIVRWKSLTRENKAARCNPGTTREKVRIPSPEMRPIYRRALNPCTNKYPSIQIHAHTTYSHIWQLTTYPKKYHRPLVNMPILPTCMN